MFILEHPHHNFFDLSHKLFLQAERHEVCEGKCHHELERGNLGLVAVAGNQGFEHPESIWDHAGRDQTHAKVTQSLQAELSFVLIKKEAAGEKTLAAAPEVFAES